MAASTIPQLLEESEDPDDDRAICELCADHPLDEIDLEYLQVPLGGEAGGVELLECIGDALRLLGRKSALLKITDELVSVSYNKAIHTMFSIPIDMQTVK